MGAGGRAVAGLVVVSFLVAVCMGRSLQGRRREDPANDAMPRVVVDGPAARPNVLVLLADDMGYSDVAAFGSPNVSTPHIDSLVRSGMKMTQWISGAPICTPSRASIQTGRYPVRTGCTGNVEQWRVVPTPSSPHGLDPKQHVSIASALKKAGYRTGYAGKWHLGDNGNGPFHPQDHMFAPNAHGYDTYLGSPYTNAPMCAPDGDGISNLNSQSPNFCFMVANTTVVQQPLRIENFTSSITDFAVDFITTSTSTDRRPNATANTPWFFFMSYFHVHTPLFTSRTNRGRSRGGQFGDNVEELDDSVGRIMSTIDSLDIASETMVFFTSDNGPYQEEGWDLCGRTNVWGDDGRWLGRMKGGKGQVFEGGIRMPGAVVWPGTVPPGQSNIFVSSMDIFPTALEVAGVTLVGGGAGEGAMERVLGASEGSGYVVDGKSMLDVVTGRRNTSMHEVMLHYCGFNILAARVHGRYKVFWAYQKWYTHDATNHSVCVECCNGVNPDSRLTGTKATELCGCEDDDVEKLPSNAPQVFDVISDPFELLPLGPSSWPSDSNTTYSEVVRLATSARDSMLEAFDPKPNILGAGTCTSGLPASWRQPCCPGCHQTIPMFGHCHDHHNSSCVCNDVPSA